LALPDLFAYYIATAPGALERPKVRAFRDWLRQEADAERAQETTTQRTTIERSRR
jgi:DNA-binding transcriptional LysR family regulator